MTQFLATGAGTSNTVSHEFVYTAAGILSSYIINDDSNINTYIITYNPSTNAYTLSDEGENYTIDLHDNNTIDEYILPVGAIEVQSNFDAHGVFQHVNIQIGTHLLLGIFNGIDFYFFNPYQVDTVTFNGTEWITNHTRDVNNSITTVNYLQGDTNLRELQINYQERNL